MRRPRRARTTRRESPRVDSPPGRWKGRPIGCHRVDRFLGRLATAGAVIGWATVAATASAGSSADFDWYGLGGCTLPVVGMPVDFDAVSPDVPAAHRARLVTAGTGDGRQAVLVFVLGRCPVNSLRSAAGTATTQDVIQVMVGALYDAGRAADTDKAQFFLLSSVVDWAPFAAAEGRMGLPAYLAEDLRLSVHRDSLTGTGSFLASVPAGPAALTATGRLMAPNPIREFPLDAAHFYEGAHGLVRVHHDETWAFGNAAEATVTAPARSPVARWMGSTSRAASGLFYWDHEEQHVHRYGLEGEPIEPPHASDGDPRGRAGCERTAARRLRCVARLAQDAEVTLRVTRRGRLYARYRRSLPAGRSTVMMRARRPVRPGAYRLTLRMRTPGGSRTTTRRIRLEGHRRG